MKKVSLLTQYFYPENAAVSQYMTELALELQSEGLELEVLTSRSTYHRAGELPRRGSCNGIPIYRFGTNHLDKRSKIGRVLKLITFILGVLFKLLFTRSKPDLLIVSNAPLLGVLGLLSRIIRGQKYICIIEDVYPDLAVKLNLFPEGSLIARVWDAINFQVYTRAQSIIVLGKRMEEVVRRKLPSSVNISVIYSWADGEAIRPLPKSENWFVQNHNLENKLVVLYSGNHGLAHDLETLIAAAERLQDNPQLQFVFIGDGAKKQSLVDFANEKRLSNVSFLPYQKLQDLPFSLSSGDVSIVAMEPGIDGMVIPSKIYGSLAAGQAILGLVGEATEVADILQEYKCGYRVNPRDMESIVELLNRLSQDKSHLNKMKENARRCFETNFSKDKAVDAYLNVIESALGV